MRKISIIFAGIFLFVFLGIVNEAQAQSPQQIKAEIEQHRKAIRDLIGQLKASGGGDFSDEGDYSDSSYGSEGYSDEGYSREGSEEGAAPEKEGLPPEPGAQLGPRAKERLEDRREHMEDIREGKEDRRERIEDKKEHIEDRRERREDKKDHRQDKARDADMKDKERDFRKGPDREGLGGDQGRKVGPRMDKGQGRKVGPDSKGGPAADRKDIRGGSQGSAGGRKVGPGSSSKGPVKNAPAMNRDGGSKGGGGSKRK